MVGGFYPSKQSADEAQMKFEYECLKECSGWLQEKKWSFLGGAFTTKRIYLKAKKSLENIGELQPL